MNKSRLIYIELCRDRLMRTDGSQTARYDELDEALGSALLYAEAVTLISNTRQKTTNFGWNVAFWSGWDRGSEIGPFWLVGTTGTTYITSGTPSAVRHPDYTTMPNFLQNTRLALVSANGTGALIESAIVSAGLLIRTWGS